MNRAALPSLRTAPSATLLWAALWVLTMTPAQALDGGILRIDTFDGWKAFEVITQNDDPSGDGFSYSMPGIFDGAGAWLVDSATLRVHTNHETGDASIDDVGTVVIPRGERRVAGSAWGCFA